MSDQNVPTAYDEDAAVDYDNARFVDAAGAAIHQRELERVLRHVEDLREGSRVLEVGCGTGRVLVELADRGLELEGTDASPEMLAELRGKAASLGLNIPLVVADAGDLPSKDDWYDFVYCVRLLNQTASHDHALQIIREMVRVTKPGGRILVEFLNRRRPKHRGARDVRLTVADLKRVAEDSGARVLGVGGAFSLGMSSYRASPTVVLPTVDRVNQALANATPGLSERCYVLLAKGGGAR